VDFLFVLSELFRCVLRPRWTSEYRLEIGVFEQGVSVWAKISGRSGRPLQLFLHGLILQCMNALQLRRWQYSHKETL